MQPRPVHLTRILFNPRHPETTRLLDNRGYLHGFVNSLMDEPVGGPDRWLYHLDLDSPDPQLTLQSPAMPVWTHVCDDVVSDYEHKEITDTFDRMSAGMVLRFRLTAAPRRDDQQGERRRYYPVPEQSRIPWLLGSLTRGGADVVDAVVVRAMVVTGSTNKNPNLQHTSVDYTGVLTVTDPERFTGVLRNGLGPAKAYGFGLLRIAAPLTA